MKGTDPSIAVHLLAAPEGADPFDKDVIRSVNPAFGTFLSEDDVMAEAERARRLAAFEPAFRDLRLNQRIDSSVENRIVTRDVWETGSAAVDLDELEGRPCRPVSFRWPKETAPPSRVGFDSLPLVTSDGELSAREA